MSISSLFLVVLLLSIIGAFPAWSYSRDWGYYPSSNLGMLLSGLAIMHFFGRI